MVVGFPRRLGSLSSSKNNQEVAVSEPWHVQGSPRLRAVLHEHILAWQEEPTELVVRRQVILEVYRAH